MFRFWVFPRHHYSRLLTASRTPARPRLSCTHTDVWLDTCNSLALTGLLPGNSSLAGVEGQPPAHHLRNPRRSASQRVRGGQGGGQEEAPGEQPEGTGPGPPGRGDRGNETVQRRAVRRTQRVSESQRRTGSPCLSRATCRRPKGLKDTRLGSPASSQFTSRASGSASREGQVPEISLPLPASKVPSKPS